MAKAPKYTKAQLQGKGLPDLRKIAKLLRINPSGKTASDLVREILKKQDGGSSSADTSKKSTAKKTSSKKPADDDEDEEDEDEEDEDDEDEEDEDEEDEKPKGKKTAAKKTAAKKTSSKKPADDEDDEEDDEEEEEEDEDSDEEDDEEDEDSDEEGGSETSQLDKVVLAIKAIAKHVKLTLPVSFEKGGGGKGKVAKSPKAKNAKKKPAEDDEDSDDDDGEGVELALSDEALNAMNLTQLKETCSRIHRDKDLIEASGGKKIDTSTSSPGELRKRIAAYLDKYASDDEGDEEEEDEEETSRPDFIKDGAKVEVDIGKKTEKWVPGVVSGIDDEEEVASITLDDGREVDSPWEHIRTRSRSKKR